MEAYGWAERFYGEAAEAAGVTAEFFRLLGAWEAAYEVKDANGLRQIYLRLGPATLEWLDRHRDIDWRLKRFS